MKQMIIPEKPKKSKYIFILLAIIILILAGVLIVSLYIGNEIVRENVDRYVLRKIVDEESTASIILDSEENPYICAFDKYVVVVSKGKLSAYNSNASIQFEFDIIVNNPISDSNEKFLVIAEKGGKRLYSIKRDKLSWNKELEGDIINIKVNKNGYIAISLKHSTYKTAIVVLDENGKEIFTTYLANTYANVVDISDDNKYIAISEINMNGISIESILKVISVEKAKKTPNEAVEYIKEINNNIIINLNFGDKGNIVCMCDDKIKLVSENNEEDVVESFKGLLFADMNLDNYIYTISQTVEKELTNAEVYITNINNRNKSTFILKKIPENVKAKGRILAINTKYEAYFINTNAYLVKKYLSTEEIKDIVLGKTIAGIVYRDKINFIKIRGGLI